jgi:protein-S-isoprenylcysteine O-methyltransferase Ste14
MAERIGIRGAAREVVQRAKNLIRLEAELARAEMRQKGRAFGAGAGMFVAAAVLAFFVLEFLLALLTAVLAIWLPVWAAILIVFVALVIVVVVLALAGRAQIRRAGPAVPERAIAQAKRTQRAVQDTIRPPAQVIPIESTPGPTSPGGATGGV